jgi:short-subunit dehydrogenase
VNVVMPGFIRTPMTDANHFSMPFLMSAEQAAAIIRRGLAANRPRIAFPFPTAFIAWAMSALSPLIADPILRMLPKKD